MQLIVNVKTLKIRIFPLPQFSAICHIFCVSYLHTKNKYCMQNAMLKLQDF